MPRRRRALGASPLPELPPAVDGLEWGLGSSVETIAWLLPGLIPAHSLTLIQGRKGSGKSTLCAAIAAALTGGPTLPGWVGPRNGRVAWYCPEEAWESAVLPRLLAAGCSADRVSRLRYRDQAGRPRSLSLPRDCESLRETLRLGGISLLVIDPYGSALGPGLSQNQDQQVRQAIEPLLNVAWECGCTLLASQHLRKGTAGDVTEHGAGSGAIVNLSRSTLRLDRHPSERRQYVLSSVARNFGAPVPSQVYTLRPAAGEVATIEWLGVCDLDADAIAEGRGSEADRDEWSDADRLLAIVLRDGWVTVGQVLTEAEHAGISTRTLRRAKARLQVRSRRTQYGQDGFWEWGPPDGGFPPDMAAGGGIPETRGILGHVGGDTPPETPRKSRKNPKVAKVAKVATGDAPVAQGGQEGDATNGQTTD